MPLTIIRNKIIAIQFLLILLLLGCANPENQKESIGEISVIPTAAEVIPSNDIFNLSLKTKLIANAESPKMEYVLNALNDRIQQLIGVRLTVSPEEVKNNFIAIQLDNHCDGGEEGYCLDISTESIDLRASTYHGLFNGVQTLLQILPFGNSSDAQEAVKIPGFRIKDAPRFSWRGIMLDESRHFFGKEKVKQLLDMMAMHKLNKFHWHLTDEPGWRIEIKAYPKLTSVGSIGSWSNHDTPPEFYSQEDISEIVDYAAQRFIEVIPEIDMPGHASAASRAYPQFSGGGSEDHPLFTFHPAKTETYQFLTDILKEVAGLFPSQYIHLGGDEVSFGNQEWKNDSDVKKLMLHENIETLKGVETYFIQRMADTLKTFNKQILGWDEIIESDLEAGSSAVMWWRHQMPDLVDNALDKGYKTILCPRVPLYFDFVQHESHQLGRRWDGDFCRTSDVYHFPDSTLQEELENPLILGIQANIWTERIHNEERFDFMLYPRMSALAEAAWTSPDRKDYQNFEVRLKKMFKVYDVLGLHYFDLFELSRRAEPEWPEGPLWQRGFE
ncbi:beta-N-acetylhexosaminidase [Fulvivirgaceae bacterium BMA10]|uniref:beta-N-acetylhexosaminidase n=1 Tax=Splendidivirga corallicola TaxID=3051826 RepID=A0ABT8KPX6_9BACT|nr:beta-N-acetylhexosaminidase [Fulvivirgaceae bacterium BMA10]